MRAYVGRRVVVEVERQSLPNGTLMDVERVVFPRVVTVLPIVGGTVVLIRQYRPALGRYVVELPSGIVEDGEDEEEAAARELEEEAGLRARHLEKVFEGVVSPGYSTEVASIYVAVDPEEAEARPETHEVIERLRVPLDEAVRRAAEGGLEDMRASLALLIYAARTGRLRVTTSAPSPPSCP